MVTATMVGIKDLQPSNSAHTFYRSPEILIANWCLFHPLQFPVRSLMSCLSSSFILPVFLHFFHFLLQPFLTSLFMLWNTLCFQPLFSTNPKTSHFSLPEPLPYHILHQSPDWSPCLCTASNSAQWMLLGELGNLSMTQYKLICFLEKNIVYPVRRKKKSFSQDKSKSSMQNSHLFFLKIMEIQA